MSPHDQAEAFALAHRIAVMNHGRIMPEGEPRAIYAQPKTAFAATFLGAANLVSGLIQSRDANGMLVVALDEGEHRLALQATGATGDAVNVIVRPEDFVVSASRIDGPCNVLAGKIARIVFLGPCVEYHLDIGSKRLRARPGASLPDWPSMCPYGSASIRATAWCFRNECLARGTGGADTWAQTSPGNRQLMRCDHGPSPVTSSASGKRCPVSKPPKVEAIASDGGS